MNKAIKLPVTLAIFCGVATAALATVYQITAPIIAENRIGAEQEMLRQMFPDAMFSIYDEEIADEFSGRGITNVYIAKENNEEVGYIYKISVKGYKGGVVSLLLSISPSGIYNGYQVLVMENETPFPYGQRITDEEYYSEFLNKSISSIAPIIAGVSATTRPVSNGIDAAADHFRDNFR